MLVDIVDVQSGNVQSIRAWVERLHVKARVARSPADLRSDFLILPGVGSAGPYMKKLRDLGFDEAIKDHVNNGGRLLGICLGFQIMGEFSSEDNGVECLGLIDGRTERLDEGRSHNGWDCFYLDKGSLEGQSLNSTMRLTKKRIVKGRVFFNHEYGFINYDKNTFSLPIASNSKKYSSLLVKGNIIGIQFHPEKSQQTGLNLLSVIL